MARVPPGRKDLLLPGDCRGNIRRGLRSSDEDQVQTALQVVGLEGTADGGGDLEGCLAQRNRGERDTCGRDQSDSLCTGVSAESSSDVDVNSGRLRRLTLNGTNILEPLEVALADFAGAPTFCRLTSGPSSCCRCGILALSPESVQTDGEERLDCNRQLVRSQGLEHVPLKLFLSLQHSQKFQPAARRSSFLILSRTWPPHLPRLLPCDK